MLLLLLLLLKQVFILPHRVAFEPYVKAFQHKILNSIPFTNVKSRPT